MFYYTGSRLVTVCLYWLVKTCGGQVKSLSNSSFWQVATLVNLAYGLCREDKYIFSRTYPDPVIKHTTFTWLGLKSKWELMFLHDTRKSRKVLLTSKKKKNVEKLFVLNYLLQSLLKCSEMDWKLGMFENKFSYCRQI